ncbi:hypothetical protein ABE042_12175 [Viridibacillus arvi]|uniref:DUF4365 domain-containing protein n=1 Tax=Viridibacillus arvi TaxID=263475 RepID=UPI003D2B7172
MIKPSNTKLERLAVQAVENEALKFNLIPNIPVGDKGISFDGDIEVMKDNGESKDSLLGKVPVQVKGNYVENFSIGKRSYPLELAHYRNFYNQNGALLFVIEINKKLETKIFYRHLLPVDLRDLIVKYGNQGTRSVELRPLSETNLYRICMLFLSESKKQAPILLENNPFKKEDFTSFRMTSLTFNPVQEETSNIYEHDFIMYGTYGNLSLPIGIARIIGEIEQLEVTVIVDGEGTKVNCELRRGPKQISILMEDSIEIKVQNTSTFEVNFIRFKSIVTQLKLLPILKAIFTGKKVEFTELQASIDGGKPKDKELIADIDDLYQLFVKLQNTFLILNIDESTEFIDEGERFIKNANSFISLVIDHDVTQLNIEYQPELVAGFILIDFAGIKFTFFLSPNTSIINGFSKDLITRNTCLVVEDESYPASPYIKLSKEGLALSQNLDLKIIKESFDLIEPFANEHVFTFTNGFCLNCIGAYEISGNKEFLELANYIYAKYENGLNENSRLIIRINQLQVNYRLNKALTNSEENELIELKMSSSNEEVLFCTSVLLSSRTEAQFFFNKLNSEIQTYYKNLPIYNLYLNIDTSEK